MTVHGDDKTNLSRIWELKVDGSSAHRLSLDWPDDLVAQWKIHGRNGSESVANGTVLGQSGAWKELRRFEAPWGYWVWSNDSKSIYVAMREAEPGFYCSRQNCCT